MMLSSHCWEQANQVAAWYFDVKEDVGGFLKGSLAKFLKFDRACCFQFHVKSGNSVSEDVIFLGQFHLAYLLAIKCLVCSGCSGLKNITFAHSRHFHHLHVYRLIAELVCKICNTLVKWEVWLLPSATRLSSIYCWLDMGLCCILYKSLKLVCNIQHITSCVNTSKYLLSPMRIRSQHVKWYFNRTLYWLVSLFFFIIHLGAYAFDVCCESVWPKTCNGTPIHWGRSASQFV